MSEIVDESNNENNDKVEQITKVPSTILRKSKDPKKVAAGKKLADYNKRAKQKQQQVKENQTPTEEENNETGNYWGSVSLTSLIAIVGLGFSALDLFLRYKNQKVKSEAVVGDYINPPQMEDENLYSTPRPQYGME